MMAYSNKFACAVKVNNKVLREHKENVFIPFGSEYSLLLKNLNTVRAIVHVFIDGEDMLPDGLVINALQEVDLQRSIKNGNLNEGNRFKFIERTENIEKHRGVKLEDGIVRVEFQFEKLPIATGGNIPWNNILYRDTGPYYKGLIGQAHGTLNNVNVTASTNSVLRSNEQYATAQSYNDAGITVPGSKSDQKFQTAAWFETETAKHSIVFKLLGETPDNKPIVKPVTVKHRPKCVTCGKVNKATAKFCSECGTSLEIV